MYLCNYYRKRRDNYISHHRIYDLCCILCVSINNDGYADWGGTATQCNHNTTAIRIHQTTTMYLYIRCRIIWSYLSCYLMNNKYIPSWRNATYRVTVEKQDLSVTPDLLVVIPEHNVIPVFEFHSLTKRNKTLRYCVVLYCWTLTIIFNFSVQIAHCIFYFKSWYTLGNLSVTRTFLICVCPF